MADYTFRFPFRLPISRSITIEDNTIKLHAQGFSVELTGESEKAIKDSKNFIIKGSGFATEKDAIEAGKKIRDTLIMTFVECKIGADFGDDSKKTFVFDSFVKKVSEEQGVQLLGNVNGLMVYPTNDKTRIISISGTLGKQISNDKFVSAFELISLTGYSLGIKEQISYSLFSNSFFTSNGYARLLFLVMAIEVLLEPAPRSQEAIDLITSFMEEVKSSKILHDNDIKSLVGGLSNLLNESIGQSARKLIESKLNDKNYSGLTANQLFQNCYNLRSSIVHGKESFPNENTVDNTAAQLELLVADLIFTCLRKTSI